ncbi:MAG: hypothetical protein AAGF57_20980 [Pseudomonadota bacterium]
MVRFFEIFFAGLLVGALVTYQLPPSDDFHIRLVAQDKNPSHLEVLIDGRSFRAPRHDFISGSLEIPIRYSDSYVLVAHFPDGTSFTSDAQEVGPGQLHYAYINEGELQTQIRAY